MSSKDNLIRLIFDPLMKHYCKEQGIDRAAELKARIKHEKSRLGAQIFVLRAELNRHLYAKYGGRVVLSAFGPFAVDAQKKWIEALEQAGDLSIKDPQLRAQLDEFLTPAEGTRFASPDQIKKAFDPTLTEKLIENAAKMPSGAQPRRDYKLVGEVFGKPIHLHQRYLDNASELPDPLMNFFVRPLEEHYRKQHPEFEPTKTEIEAFSLLIRQNAVQTIAQYRTRLAEIDSKLSQADEGSDLYNKLMADKAFVEINLKHNEENDGRSDAMRFAPPLKFQKHLYDNYGGGRVLTKRTLIAFDAQRKWVEEREELGEFQIPDPALRAKFYDNWTKGKELHGASLIDDPIKSAARLNVPWLDKPNAANQPMRKDNPNSRVGQTIVLQQEQKVAGHSPSSIRFPTKEVAEQIEQLKKEDNVTTVVTELRRITGLDFGDGAHRESRDAWLAWWSQEQDNASKAANGVRNYIVIGKVTDPEGQAVPVARVRIEVPLAASATGTYRLAQTLSDHNGKYVLAFGRLKSIPGNDADLEATFTTMKPPTHELKPSDIQKRMLVTVALEDSGAKPTLINADTVMTMGRPVRMNFTLHPVHR